MRLPKDLLTQTYKKPDIYLCETDKTRICKLETTDTKAILRFNAYSELECSVGRLYEDIIEGAQKVNPFYDKIEALRLLYVDGFGYFQIQDPEIVNNGIQEYKNITAYSLEYSLSQKYLDNFNINTGENNSLEVVYAEDKDGDNVIKANEIESIVFYNPTAFTEYEKRHSLLHLALQNTYGWYIGHVDASLRKMVRKIEASRISIYDFIMQDICDKFHCFVVFDTDAKDSYGNKINTINFYAESPVAKFIGDGNTKKFIVSPPFDDIDTVSVDGYKTTKYEYNRITGEIIFEKAPPKSDTANVEIVDGSQKKYSTDVYVTFDNLAQEVSISYSADDIKTVLAVKGADDLDIREVNMGVPYITDLSYYYSVDWMGQDLYDAYTEYLKKSTESQDEYIENAQQMLELSGYIDYEKNRLSLQYSIADHVSSTTVGKYYVRGGTAPNYYYTEVQLPSEYSAEVEHYYTLSGNDLNETKVSRLYKALQTYYYSQTSKTVTDIDELAEDFAFMEAYTISQFSADLKVADTTEDKDKYARKFLDLMWNQVGKSPLENLYQNAYSQIKTVNTDAGWNNESNENYWRYYPVTIMLDSIDYAINLRAEKIEEYQSKYNEKQQLNNQITSSLNLVNNFTNKQLIRLNAFWREDEYIDDNFIVTDADTIESSIKTKRELLESGRIELSKLCAPKLAFSMNMANIYALPEFEPIVDQFQLGNMINIEIRPKTKTEKAYVKRARMLEININFDDFSDFSCEFGELINLQTQSSIHADLLANALQAGKSVASNTSYWDKGADLATSTDLKIQQGLLGAINGLYTSDQSVTINDNGILLRKVNSDGSFSPYQAWLTSNNILLSSDGFREGSIPRTGLGEFTVNGKTFYGMLAEAMISGYIEGSQFVGGSINIGNGAFVVNEDGSVIMKASSINGYVLGDNVISAINQSAEKITINANKISLAGKEIDLTSDDITIKSTNFNVTKEGKITAKEADIEGKITASSGEIGGWTIDTDNISGINGKYKALISKSAIGLDDNVVFGVYDGESWCCYMDGVGKLYANNADIKGSITATGGSIAGYNIGSGGSYDDAIYKRVSNGSTNYEVGLKATSGSTDLAFYVKESSDNWTSSANNFYIRNDGHLYAKSADITGKITASSGNIGGCAIEDGVLKVGNANITSLDAGKITAGTMSANRISGGTIDASKIAVTNLNANNITSGAIDANVISVTNLDASNISSGTISTNRLSSSVITTGNFSSKTLSTGKLSVTNGGNIGLWTVNSNNYLYAISGNHGVSLSPTSVSHGQGGTATWVNIVKAGQNASDERLKTNIAELDNKMDGIFDSLKPVQFEYSKDFLGAGIRFGYTAQDVIKSFEDAGEDVSKYSFIYDTIIEDNSEDTYYQVNKADFIALNTWQIQKLKKRIEELENKLASLE